MQDMRLAFRAFWTTPIVSIVAVLSLALGIGANTAMFSLINSLVLRTLPVRDPQRLVTITTSDATNRGFAASWSYPVWEQLRQRELFDGMVAWDTQRFNLAQGGETQFVDGLWANGTFFETLGVPALFGRVFSKTDDVRGGGRDGAVAVISYGFWQRRFSGASDVIGRTLVLDNVPFTIIGVTPPEFFGLTVVRTFDVVVPIGDEPLLRGRETWLDSGTIGWLYVIARLKPGQTSDAAIPTLRVVPPH